MRILIESSTESEWVAQHLETLGHDVIVADPNYAAMYGSRSRKVKTDRRDVAALAEACRTGVYHRAHRASATAREARQRLRVRTHCVRQRTATINLLRAMLRADGLRLPAGIGGAHPGARRSADPAAGARDGPRATARCASSSCARRSPRPMPPWRHAPAVIRSRSI